MPERLEALLRQLLHKEPAHRPARAADVRAALESMSVDGVTVDVELSAQFPDPSGTGATTVRLAEPSRTVSDDVWPVFSGRETTHPGVASPHWRAPAELPPVKPHDWRALNHAGMIGLAMYDLRQPRLVHRDDALGQIWGAAGRSLATGRFQLVDLRGPSGTGKSSVLRWLGRRAHETGVAHVLRAHHHGTREPSDGIVPMFRRFLNVDALTGAEFEARLDRGLAQAGVMRPWLTQELSHALNPRPVDRAHSGDLTPTSRHALLLELLRELGRRRAVVLMIDDADLGRDAIEFVRHIVDSTRHSQAPVTVALATGSANTNAGAAALESLRLADVHTTIELEPLSRAGWLEAVQAHIHLEEGLASALAERAHGDLRFVRSVIGHWLRSGTLEHSRAGFVLRDPAAFRDSPDTHSLWAYHCDDIEARFGRRALDALELAAVLGSEPELLVWARLLEAADIDFPSAALDYMFDRGWLEGAESSLRMVSPSLREHLLTGARVAGRLQGWYALAADTLASATDDRPQLLARLCVGARRFDQAADLLIAAAERCVLSGDRHIARVLLAECEEALRAARASDGDTRWARVWCMEATALLGAGRVSEAEALSERACRGAQRFGWLSLLPEAARCRGHVALTRGDLDLAARWLETAITAADARHDPPGHIRESAAHALLLLVSVYRSRAQMPQAAQGASDALSRYVALGDAVGESASHRQVAACHALTGRSTLARDHLEAARAIALRHGLSGELAAVQNELGELARAAGEHAVACKWYRRSAAAFRARGALRNAVIAEANEAMCFIELGEFAEARVRLVRAHSFLVGGGDARMAAAIGVCLVVCLAAAHDWSQLTAVLSVSADVLTSTGVAFPDVAYCAERAAEIARSCARLACAQTLFELAAAQYAALDRGAEAQACRTQATACGPPYQG